MERTLAVSQIFFVVWFSICPKVKVLSPNLCFRKQQAKRVSHPGVQSSLLVHPPPMFNLKICPSQQLAADEALSQVSVAQNGNQGFLFR